MAEPELSGKGSVTCSFKDCTNRIIPRNQAFCLCRKPGHIVCCTHCVLMDPTSQDILNKYKDFMSIATEYCESKSIPSIFMLAKSVFAFPLWQKARLPHTQAKVLDDYFGSELYRCIICESENAISGSTQDRISFGDLSDQLSHVHVDVAFLPHHPTTPSTATSNPFDEVIAATPSSSTPATVSPPQQYTLLEPSPRTAAIGVTVRPLRTPTTESPLSNEEVIEGLIVLRKAVLLCGYSYDDTMQAMKKHTAAKLLKTQPMEQVRNFLVESMKTAGISVTTPSDKITPSITPPGSGSMLASSPNNRLQGVTNMKASISRTMLTPHSPAVVNPFDEEINRRMQSNRVPGTDRTETGDKDSSTGVDALAGRGVDPSHLLQPANAAPMVPPVAIGASTPTSSMTRANSAPVIPLLPIGSMDPSAPGSIASMAQQSLLRSDSGDALVSPRSLLPTGPTGPTVGPALSTSTGLSPDSNTEGGPQRRLSRTTSKKEKISSTDTPDTTNPLQNYRSGSFSAKKGGDDVDGIDLVLAACNNNSGTSTSTISMPSVTPAAPPLPIPRTNVRTEMFHKESSDSTPSGTSSVTISAANSGTASHSSSLGGANFSNLLKRSSTLDEYDAQQRLVRALQTHADNAEPLGPSAVQPLSRTSSRSGGVESGLMKTKSMEKDEMLGLAFGLMRTQSKEKDEMITIPNQQYTPRRNFVDKDVDSSHGVTSANSNTSELDSLRSTRHSPSPSALPGFPPIRKPSINTGLSVTVTLPPPSQATTLQRSSSKDLADRFGRVTPPSSHSYSSSSPNVGRPIAAFSVDAGDDPNDPLSVGSHISQEDNRSPALSDSAAKIVRSVDQMMNDSFWKDIDRIPEEHPRTLGDISIRTASPSIIANPSSVLAHNLAAATMAMSEMDALLEEQPTEVVASMRMSGKPPLHRSSDSDHSHSHPEVTPDHSRHSSRRMRPISDEYDPADIGHVSSVSTDAEEYSGNDYKTPSNRHHHHHHHRSKEKASQSTTPVVNLQDYPAIKRKLEEMASLLEREGYTREEINHAVASQTLPNLKEIQDLAYFRMLLDSMRGSKSQDTHSDGTSRLSSPSTQSSTRRTPTDVTGPLRLLRDVRIKVRFPETSMESTLVLHRGTLFIEVLETVMADLAARISSPVLMIVDQGGWSREIQRDCRYTTDLAFSLFDICDGDLIELRELATASVGPRFHLGLIADADRNNDSLRIKVRNLAKSYSGYRKIRGDGNCYYRAVVYGAFEQIINDGNRQAFRFMYDTFKSVLFSNREHNADHNEFLAAIAAASDGTGWLTVEDLESEVLNAKKKLDLAMIRACKKLISLILLKEKDVERNGLSLKDYIMPSYSDCSDVTAVCREYVLKMGVCAEGAHVDLGILPSALRCESHIVILPRERNQDVTILHTQVPRSVKKVIADVHLLFRPGHYDLLYTGRDETFLASDLVAASNPQTHTNDSPNSAQASNALSPGYSRESPSGVTPPPKVVPSSALAEQLVSILGISPDLAEKLVVKCGNIEAATEYYFANETVLKQQQQQQQQQQQMQSHPPSNYSATHAAPVGNMPQPPYVQSVPMASSQSTAQHASPYAIPYQHQHQLAPPPQPGHVLPPTAPSQGYPHQVPQQGPPQLNRDAEERILASAISQYPYLGQPPLRDIINQARSYRFPVRDVIDSIVVYKNDSIHGVVTFCAQVGNRGMSVSPAPVQIDHINAAQTPAALATARAELLRHEHGPASSTPITNAAMPPHQAAGGGGGLGRESDMADMRKEQQQHPELNDPNTYALIHQVVVGLGYRLHDVVMAVVTARCKNVFSILRTIHCAALRISNDMASYCSVIDDTEDTNLVNLIGHHVTVFKAEKTDVVEAAIFDYCRSFEDFEDHRSYRSIRSAKDYQSAPKSIDPQLPRDGKLRAVEFKISGMDRGEIIRQLLRLSVGMDESEYRTPTRILRQKLRNGIYAKMDRVNYF